MSVYASDLKPAPYLTTLATGLDPARSGVKTRRTIVVVIASQGVTQGTIPIILP